MTQETSPRRKKTLLLVDDNFDDAALMQRSLQRANLPVTVYHVHNGLECMNFLRKAGPYSGASRPDLILLDLNMPIMDGRETLSEIVKDDDLRLLPVVVFTTSNLERDRADMYRLGCNSYIRKPIDSVAFEAIVKQLGEYWFKLVVSPYGETSED